MRTQRQLRVGEELRHIIAALFMRDEVPWPQEFDPPIVTVSEVQVSPDLKNATVFVMPLGGKQMKETVRVLNDMVGFFRHAVSKEIALRVAPRLRFSADTSFDYAQHIDDVLRKANEGQTPATSKAPNADADDRDDD